tara:strand:- start:5153 stop:5656 length:504 start_codon:yes stop_codon:yes gene_type:complete
MNFFSIDAYSSVWFWALLTIAWLIAIDKTSVLSYSSWLKASKDGELGQKEIMKSFYLKQGKLLNQENNLSLLLLCFFSFLVVNWFIIAFLYSVEFLQAAFLLYWPFIVCIFLRLCLRQSIGDLYEASFKDVLRKVKFFRRIVVIVAFVSLISSITWGSYFNLKTNFF